MVLKRAHQLRRSGKVLLGRSAGKQVRQRAAKEVRGGGQRVGKEQRVYFRVREDEDVEDDVEDDEDVEDETGAATSLRETAISFVSSTFPTDLPDACRHGRD